MNSKSEQKKKKEKLILDFIMSDSSKRKDSKGEREVLSKIERIKEQIKSLENKIKRIHSKLQIEKNEIKSSLNQFNILDLLKENPNSNKLKGGISSLKSSSSNNSQIANKERLKKKLKEKKEKLNFYENKLKNIKTHSYRTNISIKKDKGQSKEKRKPKSFNKKNIKNEKPRFIPAFKRNKKSKDIEKIGNEIIFSPSWKDIIFGNGYINVNYKNQNFKIEISKSKTFLNEIKSYYSFKNVPLLKIKINNYKIVKIENIELLFFHIDFLNSSRTILDYKNIKENNINKWKVYTKSYFKKYLYFMFHTKSLKKLCEICDEKLPIIPIAEMVINSNGYKEIHNSFLFPLNTKTGYIIIWESIEEAKASYVFDIKSDYHLSCQNLYDYLTGEIINKRETLINSNSLKEKLKLKERIFHTDYDNWLKKIKLLD